MAVCGRRHAVAAFSDPELQRWVPPFGPLPGSEPQRWVDQPEQPVAPRGRQHFAVRGPGDVLAGGASLRFRDMGEMAAGYRVAPTHRGRGLAPGLLRLLADHAFAAYGAHPGDLPSG